MFYPKLAVTNIGKNRKSYLPYILTCVLTVMMFYTMDAICKNEGVRQMPGADSMMVILNMASWITGIFSAIFLFYTNSFLVKQRKKEFGVYQVLGMDKRNLTKMLLWESVFTAAVSLGLGLLLGILLGKLMFLILLKMINFSVPLSFSIEPEAIVRTLFLFGIIFLVTFSYNLFQLRKANPVELLHGGNVGEREPKTKWLFTLIGVVTLAVGYGIAVTTESPLSALSSFFIAVILVIIGTYALFTAGSIAFLKILKKKKNFYYRPNHFATVSGMLYRMKQNAVGLANICIMSTIVLVLISVTVSLYTGMNDILSQRFPTDYHISLANPDTEKVAQIQQIVEEELECNDVKTKERQEMVTLSLAAIKKENALELTSDLQYTAGDMRALVLTTLECYNAMEKTEETLESGEILFCSPKGEFSGDSIRFGDQSYKIKEQLSSLKMEKYDNGPAVETIYAVVSDIEELYRLAETYDPEGRGAVTYHQYFNPKGEEEDCTKALKSIYERGAEMEGTYFEWRQSSEESFYQLYGGFLFMGVFVGFLFLMGTVLIIYYKQISEGYDDRERFQIMRKVGMSQKEVKRTIRSQVLTVFFLPLGAAMVHLAVAFPVLTKLMRTLNLTNVKLEAVCTVGTVCIFTVFYILVFMITSREYYRIVK